MYKNKSQAKKQTGLSYLGGINTSSKIEKGEKFGYSTYILYLAPAKTSGYEVCPMRTEECTRACLSESGHNRIDTKGTINKARIKKTKLFFEDREFFMRWLVDEIRAEKTKAEKEGKKLAIRLNGTSDLNPVQFHLDGKNILEIFPDVQFYDYTKVLNRLKLVEKYPNYDLTFSFSGHNMPDCLYALANGVRVAMVFNQVPENYLGYEVVNGDLYDMRFLDGPSIVGLKYKKVRNKLEDSAFVI